MKKLFLLIVFLIITLFVSGCKNKYDLKIIDEEVIFKQDFLDNNSTYGAHKTIVKIDENGKEYFEFEEDLTSPESRTFIIRNKEESKKIFSIIPEIDFNKETIILYMYTSVRKKDETIKNIKLDNGVLEIKFFLKRVPSDVIDGTQPYVSVLVVRTKNIDFDDATFQYIN